MKTIRIPTTLGIILVLLLSSAALMSASADSIERQGAPTTYPTAEVTANPTAEPGPTLALAASPTLMPTANPTTAPTPAPTITPLINLDDPNRAMAIDGTVHILAAKSAIWYAFDYAISDNGDRPTSTVTLVGGNHSGVRFEVWTPDNLNNWWEKKPIGRGTANNLPCNNTDQSDPALCQSNDLTWGGAFNAGMKIYVRVVNDNDHPTPFQLTLQ